MSVRFVLSALCLGTTIMTIAATTLASDRLPVVAELFTSEGCSSCPPADIDLARLASKQPVDGVEIIPLAWHIDYWDRLGWKDPFSSQLATGRQNQYGQSLGLASVYTPQLIIDGKSELIGGDPKSADDAIKDAKENPKTPLAVSLDFTTDPTNGKVQITVANLPKIPANESFELLIAVTEDGLTSKPTRGENAHRNLAHSAVVRSAQFIPVSAAGVVNAPLALSANWKRENLHLVAVLQGKSSRRIFGAASIPIP